MDEKLTKRTAGGTVVVIVAGTLGLPNATREDLVKIAAELHRPPVAGEPIHTETNTPALAEYLFEREITGITASAPWHPPKPAGFISWTPPGIETS